MARGRALFRVDLNACLQPTNRHHDGNRAAQIYDSILQKPAIFSPANSIFHSLE